MKNKIRLKGISQKQLHSEVLDRDNNCCVVCGKYVPEGTKAHHEPPKSHGGQDILENLVTLCYECHFKRHHGKDSTLVKRCCEQYLYELYG